MSHNLRARSMLEYPHARGAGHAAAESSLVAYVAQELQVIALLSVKLLGKYTFRDGTVGQPWRRSSPGSAWQLWTGPTLFACCRTTCAAFTRSSWVVSRVRNCSHDGWATCCWYAWPLQT